MAARADARGSEPRAEDEIPAGAEVPGALRFFRAFLEERNIRWMLLAGILIVLGSSLKLVISAWPGTGTLARLALLTGYAGAVHLAGRFAWRRLVLRRTGLALQALAVLLVPLLGLATRTLGALATPAGAALALACAVGSAALARDALATLLRGAPPAALAAFLALAWAPPLLPAGPLAAQVGAGLAIVALLFAGTIKANRHLFWLEEDGKSARTFRLFPFVLLGAAALSDLFYVLGLPAAWIGFFVVLAALAFVQAGEALLRVHRLRTVPGDPSLPLRVALPFVAGAMASAAGLVLASGDLRALVPAAAVEAGALFWLARRHGRPALVYPAIACAAVAYQFSWIYYEEIADLAIRRGAELVREERLPLPFYGLAYLPFMIGCLGAAALLRRRGEARLARPLRRAGAALSLALVLVSLFDPKAAAATAPLMGALYLAGVRVYRTERLALPALLCLLAGGAAAAGLAAPAPAGPLQGLALAALAAAYAALAIARPSRRFLGERALLAATAVAATGAIAFALSPASLDALPATTLAATLALSGLALGVLTVRRDTPRLAAPAATLLTAAVATLAAGVLRLDSWGVALAMTGWAAALMETSVRASAAPSSLRAASRAAALVVAGGAAIALAFGAAAAAPPPSGALAAALAAAVLAREALSRPAAVAAGGAVLAGEVALFAALRAAFPWPDLTAPLALAAIVRTAALLVLDRLRPRSATGGAAPRDEPALRAAAALLGATSFATAVLGLMRLGAAPTLAALAGALGVVLAGRRTAPRESDLGWILLTIAAPIAALAPGATSGATLPALLSPAAIRQAPFMAAALALAAAPWALRAVAARAAPGGDPAARGATIGAGAAVVVLLLAAHARPALPLFGQVAAAVPFVAGIALAAWAALRTRAEPFASLALVLAGLFAGDLALWGVIEIGHGMSRFAALAGAFALDAAARATARTPAAAAFPRPLRVAARLLAAAAAVLALSNAATAAAPLPRLGSALALFGAAAFFGRTGLETGRRRWLVLATAAADAGAILLFRTAGLHDLGFVLVPSGIAGIALAEALSGRIDEGVRVRLRTAAALAVVVAPMPSILAHGSWAHVFALLLLSTALGLAGIQARVRSFVYVATAFLAVDLVSMVAIASLDEPDFLWAAGLALGALVIAGGALFESRRDRLIEDLRRLAAELGTWQR